MPNNNVLVIGRANSGKTQFAGQLYGRLQETDSALKISKTPANLEMLGEVLEALSQGNVAGHTVAETWDSLELPIVNDNNHEFIINWPEYAGEQWDTIFSTRSMSEQWKEQLESSNRWLIIIRLAEELTYPDFLDKLPNNTRPKKQDEPATSSGWDANAYWVEKLQILLHLSKIGTSKKVKQPKIAVLLSCYDELDADEVTPNNVLEKRLPLLASFLLSNWEKNSLSIWGLSALGKDLKPDSNDDDFIDEGAENQGWVIAPNETLNNKDADLTLPIKWLLDD
ncbi:MULTISPECIES: hypothetical protein [unclassified Psychrobacter]|uniref:TRAFAC clade GTPase domain-containing protein n=1 Tax=unclassified Psychrobacter TaxID=196806 RepID=UPI0025CD73AA|nr:MULTISPECIES: hypothetical protein [unclassified Psychrobacter]